MEAAAEEIAAQQKKLTSTNELVTAMFSKGLDESIQTAFGNTPTFVLVTLPSGQKGAVIFLFLKNAPIFQTVQLQWHVYTQPKYSYLVRENVLRFSWGDPAESLKQYPLVVSYVPDPTYNGVLYKALSLKDGHVYADEVQLQ
jgi:hypothetical protein